MKSEIRKYLIGVPKLRKERYVALRNAFVESTPDVKETMKYRMPTFEKGPNWVAIGNQKNHLSVYFCSESLIENIHRKHPAISTGKGCVRIKDNQELPLKELVVSFKKAMKFKKTANQAL